ncbi:SanA/YdcF family protein [Micromonospora auratinigra]|uniref:Protein SanA, affects membrane permeability for vancomycin n=1 Tax=Micromonospora auratinigra TaxID=261654 RepID=A0A1A8ZTU0_9ACTN|nr:ElyC/SanA/YdcF family protein [Micromonospora auratinigra]SBT47325.1 protein SanA, affects membrane permeability for vancomycin [Micromonospora auratinigra]
MVEAVGQWCGRRRRLLRRVLLTGVVGGLLLAGATVGSATWVRAGAAGHLYPEAEVPSAPVALVLGTKVGPDGEPSPFLAARLEIARRLLAAGKVRAILVSGDNMHHDYNEPDAMRRWLVERGVPARQVVLDYAGFDTYDSCARAKRIFGVDRATVVTQSFHLPRAVSLCRHLGIDANGVGDDSARRYGRWRISAAREYGACVKAALDLLSGRDPAQLGRHETGVEDALRQG